MRFWPFRKKKEEHKTSDWNSIEGAERTFPGHSSFHRFPPIAQITEIDNLRISKWVKNKDARIIDDFAHANPKLYTVEEELAEAEWVILTLEGKGSKCLRVHYHLSRVPDHRSVDIARKFIQEDKVLDWSTYSHINLVLKNEKATSLLRVVVVEKDGDWWNFINTEIFESDTWYHIQIPLDAMYLLDENPFKGDGKQDFSQVAEIRLIFDGTNLGHNPTENTVQVSSISLT